MSPCSWYSNALTTSDVTTFAAASALSLPTGTLSSCFANASVATTSTARVAAKPSSAPSTARSTCFFSATFEGSFFAAARDTLAFAARFACAKRGRATACTVATAEARGGACACVGAGGGATASVSAFGRFAGRRSPSIATRTIAMPDESPWPGLPESSTGTLLLRCSLHSAAATSEPSERSARCSLLAAGTAATLAKYSLHFL
mmetsp:Transcript_15462/g.31059  ORF Transcript_15462/g.31059 Transcript_15462/m.31059 type:complete len:204 (-) Transcript_15462:86-697(-)